MSVPSVTRSLPNSPLRCWSPPGHHRWRGAGAMATLAAFFVPALESWRPITVSGLGVGVVGTSIFLWQRSAARRGSPGAQTGLSRTDIHTDTPEEAPMVAPLLQAKSRSTPGQQGVGPDHNLGKMPEGARSAG